MNQNPYETLDVDSTATLKEIKYAYKKLAGVWHPDKWVGSTEGDRRAAEVEFKQIEEAYRVLKDPINRAHYDQTGEGNMPKSKDLAVKKIISLFQKHIKEALEQELKADLAGAALGSTGITFFQLDSSTKNMSNIIRTVRKQLKHDKKVVDEAIKNLTKGVAKLNKYKRKVRTKEGTANLYAQVIEQQLQATQGALAQGGIEAIALETALASLDDYEYVLEDEPELLIESDVL